MEQERFWLRREEYFVRDAARTSPRSHVVVEKVLYACICLSVPLRIFTRRRRGPAICRNTRYLCFLLPSHFSCPFLFFAVAVLEICCCHCDWRPLLTRVPTVVHKSSVKPTLNWGLLFHAFLVLVGDGTDRGTHLVGEDGGGTGGRWRDGRLTHTNRPYHIKVFEVCLVSLMRKTAAFACRAVPDGSSQNTHFMLHSRFTFAPIHPSVGSKSSSSSNTPGHNFNNKS